MLLPFNFKFKRLCVSSYPMYTALWLVLPCAVAPITIRKNNGQVQELGRTVTMTAPCVIQVDQCDKGFVLGRTAINGAIRLFHWQQPRWACDSGHPEGYPTILTSFSTTPVPQLRLWCSVNSCIPSCRQVICLSQHMSGHCCYCSHCSLLDMRWWTAFITFFCCDL